MKRTLSRRILRNTLVLTSTLLACTALQAQQNQLDRSATSANTPADSQTSPRFGNQPQGRRQHTGQFGQEGQQHWAKQDNQQNLTADSFIRKALMGGKMEVQVGQLAQQKGQNEQVKNLGKTLVEDHTLANQQLKQLASSKNIQVSDSSGSHSGLNNSSTVTSTSVNDHTGASSSQSAANQAGQSSTFGNNRTAGNLNRNEVQRDNLSAQGAAGSTEHGSLTTSQTAEGAHRGQMTSQSAKMQREFAHLQSQSGEQFDKAFVKMAIKDHKKDIAEFEKARTQLQDPQIDAFIDQTLPKLQKHLQMAQSAAQQLGVDTSKITADEDGNDAASTGAPATGTFGTSGSSEHTSGTLNSDNQNSTTTIRPGSSTKNEQSSVIDNSQSSGKIFEKGDGKVLGLPTDKNDGKYLGIIPAPGHKDRDANINADVNVNGNDASIGGAASSETGSGSGSK